MKSDMNEQLCMKFAVEILNVVNQVKKNRQRTSDAFQMPTSSDTKYFVRNTDLKKFLQSTEQSCCLYLALSVGQYYHEGEHAQSQVTCLQNIRQSYEKWLQAGFSELNKQSDCLVKLQWQVKLIVTDSHQALNDFPAHDVDLSTMQCHAFITNPALAAFEARHEQKGAWLEQQYRHLFSANNDWHEKNAKVKFEFSDATIRWTQLKQFYHDPQFIEMVNYLERCLKFGLQLILTAIKTNAKLPANVLKKVKAGLFDKWSDALKLNDISYVIVEVAMLYYKIFQTNSCNAKFDNKFLLYPGPLDVMLGVGRNLLAMHFKEVVCSAPFTFLRMQDLVKLSESTDKEAVIFAGDCKKVEPSIRLIEQRVNFISQAVDTKVNRAKFVLLAMNEAMEKKLAKEARRKMRKAQEFLETPYAQYLCNFQYYSKRYGDAITLQLGACQFQWDTTDPIASVDRLCAVLNETKECVDSPRLSRLNSFVSEIYFSAKLVELRNECLAPLARKFHHTQDAAKKKVYLTQLVCRLVQYAVEAKHEFEAQELPTKRAKVDTIHSVVKTCQTFFSGSLSSSQENIAKEPDFYIRFQSLMIFCIANLGAAGVIWNDLFNPEFYPSTVPEVDYRSSQEPSQSSLPEMM